MYIYIIYIYVQLLYIYIIIIVNNYIYTHYSIYIYLRMQVCVRYIYIHIKPWPFLGNQNLTDDHEDDESLKKGCPQMTRFTIKNGPNLWCLVGFFFGRRLK